MVPEEAPEQVTAALRDFFDYPYRRRGRVAPAPDATYLDL
jgi:hypothetical protein